MRFIDELRHVVLPTEAERVSCEEAERDTEGVEWYCTREQGHPDGLHVATYDDEEEGAIYIGLAWRGED